MENIFDVQDLLVNEIIDELIGRGYVLEKQTLKIASKKNINDLSTYECLTKATSISQSRKRSASRSRSFSGWYRICRGELR